MTVTRRYFEPLILLCIAVVLFVSSRLDVGYYLASHFPLLITVIDSQVLLPSATLIAALAIVSYLATNRNSSLWHQLNCQYRYLSKPRVELTAHDLYWVGFAIFLGIAVRVMVSGQPIRYDEAFTLLHFATARWTDVFYYPLPNNHVLHTLFVHIFWLLLGDSQYTLRLPSLLFSIASIPLAFWLSRKLNCQGRLTLIGMASFPYLVFYGAVARGYSLLVLLVIVLALIVIDDRPPRQFWLPAAFVSALALLTMPSALFPIAGIIIWSVANKTESFSDITNNIIHFLLPYCLTLSVFSLLFYAPVLMATGGGLSIFQNRFVAPLPWHEFLSGLPVHLHEAGTELLRDNSLYVLIIILIGVLASLSSRRVSTLLLCLILGACTVLFATRAIPYARTWIYWIPFLLIAADKGWGILSEKIRKSNWLSIARISLTICLLMLGWKGLRAPYGDYQDLGLANHAMAAAENVAERLRSMDVVCAPLPLDEPVKYYLRRKLSRSEMQARGSGEGAILLVGGTESGSNNGHRKFLQQMPRNWSPESDFKGSCFLAITVVNQT